MGREGRTLRREEAAAREQLVDGLVEVVGPGEANEGRGDVGASLERLDRRGEVELAQVGAVVDLGRCERLTQSFSCKGHIFASAVLFFDVWSRKK